MIKTQLPLRGQIITTYESMGIDSQLESSTRKLTGSDKDWETFKEDILKDVSVLVYRSARYQRFLKHRYKIL